jgi:hypothetical protein
MSRDEIKGQWPRTKTYLEVTEESSLIERNVLVVVVLVGLRLKSGILEDGDVVGPGWVGQVDLLLLQKATHEVGSNTESTSTGEDLGRDNLVCSTGVSQSIPGACRSEKKLGEPQIPKNTDLAFLDDVSAKDELGSNLVEFRNAGDTSILVVQLGVEDFLLGLHKNGFLVEALQQKIVGAC